MQRGVIVVIVLLSLAGAPFAMALDGCSGMGTACGMSCSAPCISVSAPTSDLHLASVEGLAPIQLARVPAAALKTLDAPPKSPFLA